MSVTKTSSRAIATAADLPTVAGRAFTEVWPIQADQALKAALSDRFGVMQRGGDMVLPKGADGPGAAALVRAALAPTADLDAVALATKVLTLPKAKFDGDGATKLRVREFARLLAKYPADVARHVVEQWCDRETWTPAYAELRAKLEAAVSRRRAMLADVERLSSC